MAKGLHVTPLEPEKLQRGTPEVPRQEQIRLDKNETAQYVLGIEQHDEAILDYMQNQILPGIFKKGKPLDVYLSIGNKELWSSYQEDGYVRDKNGKLLLPVLLVNKESLTRNDDMPRKVDANLPIDYHYFESVDVKTNHHDKLGNRPTSRIYSIVIPDYVILSYSGVIMTNYQDEMNKIQEALLYQANSYWGKEGHYRFLVSFSDFTNESESVSEGERIIRSTFDFTVKGYILSDNLARSLQTKVHYTQTKVVVRTKYVKPDGNVGQDGRVIPSRPLMVIGEARPTQFVATFTNIYSATFFHNLGVLCKTEVFDLDGNEIVVEVVQNDPQLNSVTIYSNQEISGTILCIPG